MRMLAVIALGGKQYQVKPGTKFKTEKINLAEGKTFEVEQVLMISEDDGQNFKMGMPLLKEEKVVAKVLEHNKADKIRVFKMKAKKRYSRVQGHRQQFSELEIVEINGVKAPVVEKKIAAPKLEKPQGAEVKNTPASKETKAAKKTAAKKVTKTKKTDKVKSEAKKAKTEKPAAKAAKKATVTVKTKK